MKALIKQACTVSCLEGSVVEITDDQFQVLEQIGAAEAAKDGKGGQTRKPKTVGD